LSELEQRIAAAEAYEENLVSAVFGPWAEKVIEWAAPQPGETVLDLACGTGIGARLAAPRMAGGGSITSTDSDAGMVTVAERIAARSELPKDVKLCWQVAPAEVKVVKDGTVDLCICLQGPQFVNDPPLVMHHVRDALRQGGRLAASMWNVISENKGHYAIAKALEARGVPPALKPFSMGDTLAARQLVTSSGLEIARFETMEYRAWFPSARAFIQGVAAGAPATRHAIAKLPDEEREAFLRDVEDQLSSYTAENGVALPTSAHILLAIRES
jgi:ubiquinone/menaquinone biosynthesis C-methylase UbiE